MQKLETFIALNRFGLGATPHDSIDGDPRGWIVQQISSQQTPALLQPFKSSQEILQAVHSARADGPESLRTTTRELYRTAFQAEIIARTRHMVQSTSPFAERMVMFWSNHFTVSNSKRIIGPAIPAFEREAIRPHIFGTFNDMLKAVSSHAVMISYLDNATSAGENSRAGMRRRRNRGNKTTLNENLAREILELHTLGVNGGYRQQDVVALAKVISGWSHGGLKRMAVNGQLHGGFEFRPAFHEPGDKTIIGKTYREAGVDEGFAVLRDLAHHPATARHIASKLVQHFVNDNPPPAAVESIASVFQHTNGDLAAVSKALVELPEVWQHATPKTKNHYEFVVAVHRATGNRKPARADILRPLREMGQIPFTAASPAGWPDRARDWIAPEALMRRIEWVRGYAAKLPAATFPDQLLDSSVGAIASDQLRTWVSRAPSADAANAMVLASPEFQRR